MGYMHIENLYRNQTILEFPEVYALEKIHGTSAHIKFKKGNGLSFYSGGETHAKFVSIFDGKHLETALESFDLDEVIVHGEAYGGKQQGMRATYGDELKFIVFDVKFNGNWLTVPHAETVAKFLKLEFVDYVKIKTDLALIDAERDRCSTQAIRNGVGEDKKREGVVLRPLEELVDTRGNRIIAKHKNAEFCETKTPRTVDPDKKKVLSEANAIALEWVTHMRLQHVLDAVQSLLNVVEKHTGSVPLNIADTKQIIDVMQEDIKREAKDEIVVSPQAMKAIANRTAKLYHNWLQDQLKEKSNAN